MGHLAFKTPSNICGHFYVVFIDRNYNETNNYQTNFWDKLLRNVIYSGRIRYFVGFGSGSKIEPPRYFVALSNNGILIPDLYLSN